MDLATAAEYLAGTREFTGTLRGIVVDFSVLHLNPDIFLAAAQTSVIGRHCALILMGATEDLEPARRFNEAFPTVYFANKPPTGRELLTLLDANPQFSSSSDTFPKEGSHDEERVPIFGKAVKARVLLADDNLINRQLARIFLNQLGAQVDEADTGMQAVEACRINHYDLILMDIHMPNMDGLEATRRIRTLEDSANSVVPVIALTADAMNQERAQYLDAGMNDHLSKPITEESLRSILEKWCLGNNTQLRSSR
jgi:CheY-like chemotaxis protein